MNPGDTVQVDRDGETAYGVFPGERDGYAQVAFYTGNVPLDQVTAVARPITIRPAA